MLLDKIFDNLAVLLIIVLSILPQILLFNMYRLAQIPNSLPIRSLYVLYSLVKKNWERILLLIVLSILLKDIISIFVSVILVLLIYGL
jgi:hypothetical protein